MIDFWKDNNRGLPERATVIQVRLDTISLMKKLLDEGFEEVCCATKIKHRTFFLLHMRRVVVYRIPYGYQVYETLCFSGVIR